MRESAKEGLCEGLKMSKRRFITADDADNFEQEEEWEKDRETLLGSTVHEYEGPEYTGLLDQDGNRIYRERLGIGFLADL
jgi:hypothetical protein